VLLNGLIFHFTGWSRYESFQTVAGLRKALHNAGFVSPSFRQESNVRLIAQATRPAENKKIASGTGPQHRAARAG
jgi:hypothetical protein